MSFGKFSIRLAAFSGVLAILLQLIITKTDYVQPVIWGAYAFFVVMTLVVFYLSSLGLKMSIKNSMSIILGSLVFRLFSSLIFLIIYLMVSGERDIPYVVAFMILYLLFQVFEIYHLVTILRPDSKR